MPKIAWAADVRADALLLLSCNSLNVAGQLDEHPVSLARAAIEDAGVPTVLGSTRQVPLPPEQRERVSQLWVDGHAVTCIARYLNQTLEALGSPGAYVVLGDPGSCAASAPLSAAEALGAEAGDVSSLQETADAWLTRVLGFEAFLFSASARLRRARDADGRRLAQEQIQQLVQVRQLLCLMGHARQADARTRLADAFNEAVAAHDRAAAHLIGTHLLQEGQSGAGVGDMLSGCLRHGLDGRERQLLPEPCSRCGSLVDERRWSGRWRSALERECPGCGVLFLGSPAFASGTLDLSHRWRAGGSLEWSWSAGGAPYVARPGVALVQLRDKSQTQPVYESSAGLPVDTSLSGSVGLGADAGPDQGSFRLVLVHGLEVALIRRVGSIRR